MANMFKCLDGDAEFDSLQSAVDHAMLTRHTLTKTQPDGTTLTVGIQDEDDDDLYDGEDDDLGWNGDEE